MKEPKKITLNPESPTSKEPTKHPLLPLDEINKLLDENNIIPEDYNIKTYWKTLKYENENHIQDN